MKIPFSPPYIDQSIIDEVTDTLTSGWITTGPKVQKLEAIIQNYVGCKACNAVNSWTSGAILSLKWLGVKAGDEVIVPAYTYCATAMAVIEAGAKPVMVDVTDNLTIDVSLVRKAITPHTKAILPVDIGGIPCDYTALKAIVEDEEIKKLFVPESENQRRLGRIMLLSDSAHSLGAKLHGKDIAQLTDICVISTHAVKNITSAEGGIICLNLPDGFDHEALHKWFKMMSLNGQTKDSFTKTQLASWRYDIVEMGLKINMPDVCAAIALAQMRKYDWLLKERKRVFDRYYHRLRNCPWAVMPPVTDDSQTLSYHLFILRINDISEEQRDRIIELLAAKEIATNVHYTPMPMLTVFRNMGYNIDDYPVSRRIFSSEITLPLYPQLTDEQVDFLLDNLIEIHDTLIGR